MQTRFHNALAAWVGLVYLALLPLCIPVRGQLGLHDLLAPLLLGVVALQTRACGRELIRPPQVVLAAFLVLAAGAMCCHFSKADAYEFAIFGYMAVIFWFFRNAGIKPKPLFVCGVVVLLAFCLYALGEALLGVRATHDVYAGSTLDFLRQRFFFRFEHPNLAGSYYALPVLCVLVGARRAVRTWTPRGWFWRGLVFGVLCVPLLLTVSRHMLLSFALVLGFLLDAAPARQRRTLGWVGFALLLSVFGLFALTVWFPFFPVGRVFPFINCATPGMYMIHQEIYLKMVTQDVQSLLIGPGRERVLATYRVFADPEAIRAVLTQYNQLDLLPRFATYMDAHNEYLNLATAFGVPAMVTCMAFWVTAARPAQFTRVSGGAMLAFFVLGVVMVSFWDDILSKRWIWAGLGILSCELRTRAVPASSDASAAVAEP